jgi:ABC-type branched-subunit amino acid transport system ATPase component/ABC-type branched-subunit amino acid transport system permease subunit
MNATSTSKSLEFPTGAASVCVIGIGIALACIPFANGYYLIVLANIALLAIVGIGLNVVQGLTGQVSLGHAAFYTIGAYAVGILTTRAGWSFWAAWPVALVLAGATGALLSLPALRVKGPYLAMITIAFGFVIEHAVIELKTLTGGHNGISSIPSPSFRTWEGDRSMTVVAIMTAAICLALFFGLSRSAWGAAMRAVRDSDPAAQSIGINPLIVKTVAFAISAALAGTAGGLLATITGFVAPSAFGFNLSVMFVLLVALGGAGTVGGPVLGAVIIALLPELLSGMEEYSLLIFGGMLLLVVWVAPQGAVGLLAALVQGWRLRRGRTRAVRVPQHIAGAPSIDGRMRPSMEVRQLSMQFGGVRAVNELSFDSRAGAITSLIGPNGAGKTTALNVLSGYYKPSGGSFSLGGAPLENLPSFRVARRGIARTFQTSQLFASLSVEENIAIALCRGKLGSPIGTGKFRSAKTRARARELAAFCGYAGDCSAIAGDLPHVDKRYVEIARALAIDPDMILLDEPAAGLSAHDKASLGKLLQKIATSGIGVLVVEHDMTLVMRISSHIVVLDAGHHLASGVPKEIQLNERVRQAYLGESAEGDATRPDFEGHRTVGASMPQELLGVGALVAGYGAEPVLHGIDLIVRRGQVVSLLGANGAGKSTLMRAISGLHRPVSGGINLDGENLVDNSAEWIVRKGLALVPEGRQVFPELTVVENICLGAFRRPLDAEQRLQEMFALFPRLKEREHQRAGLLSGGEQQMLAVARALMSQPQILLLDEPSLGLAPKVIASLFDTLEALRTRGMTMLLSDQMANLALRLSDWAYVIEGGRIVSAGPARLIAESETLTRAYLGAAAEITPQTPSCVREPAEVKA